MEPQQILFGYLLEELRLQGYAVYDGALPPDGAPYPFIYLADSQTIDAERKDAVQGTVYQTVHIWHDKLTQRGVVSSIMLAVKATCRKLENERHWCVSSLESKILADTTTDVPLMHGIIEVGMQF